MARINSKDKGVFERPSGSGIWWVRYMVNRKVGWKTDAKAFYMRTKAQILEGRYEPERPRILTLGVWLSEYMKTVTTARPGSQRAYAAFWAERLGDRALASIKANELERIQASLSEEGRLAQSTINRYYALLKHSLNIAIRDGLIKENPVTRVQFYKEVTGRTIFLTEADEARLRETIPSETWPFVELAIHTGLRQSEQFNLRWENIDLGSRVLTIPLSKSGETRHVPLNEKAHSILKELKSRQVLLSPWVFPSPVDHTKARDGNALYKKAFVPAVEKAGLPGVV